MENQIRVLSTKMLTDQQKRLLLNANFSIDEADFINVVNQSFDLKSSNDYLIFTSQYVLLTSSRLVIVITILSPLYNFLLRVLMSSIL